MSTLQDAHEVVADRSRAQADRLAAVWRVAHNGDLSDLETMQAVLTTGAALIRPGRRFVGGLTRTDGGGDAIENAIVASGQTHAWDDVLADPQYASAAAARTPVPRALIGTPFQATRETYCLTFAAAEPNVRPFDADDAVFVELLARFFATLLQQTWQTDRIRFQIAHDSLTGLRNRRQFRIEARAALSTEPQPAALAIVALDAFRRVNELHGHLTGDALLVEVGAALEAAARPGEIVARLDGDRFGVFMPHLATREQAEARAAGFRRVFEQPFSTGDREGTELVPLGATIGVALATRKADLDDLLSRAESAVYLSKLEGAGGTSIDVAESPAEQRARSRLNSDLAGATAGGEFALCFQPQLDTLSGRIVAAEALVRWNHPAHGQLLPAEFVPLAEQSGLIRAVSMWVIVEALRSARVFRRFDPNFRVFVNLSVHDLADMSIVDVFTTAAECGTSLANLGVELTETAVMQDVTLTHRIVTALQLLGVQVAIDDFGSGYSSLSLLRRIPFDLVKIHRGCVIDAPTNHQDAALIESVVALGEHFGYTTVAQGVESEGLLRWLAEHGCRRVQGYAISNPLPAAHFARWLRRRERASNGQPAADDVVIGKGNAAND